MMTLRARVTRRARLPSRRRAMEDFATHEVRVELPRAARAVDEQPLHPLVVLLLTIAIAALLSYVLLSRDGKNASKRAPPQAASRKDEPEEYFQKILADVKLDTWSGTEQGCRWSQTDDEVEVIAPLPTEARAKDVVCKILPGSIALAVRGTSTLRGALFKKVRHEDCDWSIEELNGERVLKLTLVKVVPTKGAQHWTQLLQPPDV